MVLPHFNVFAQNARTGFAGKDVAELIDGAEFRPAAGRGVWVAALIENEVSHPAQPRVADADALLEARIIDIVRFGI